MRHKCLRSLSVFWAVSLCSCASSTAVIDSERAIAIAAKKCGGEFLQQYSAFDKSDKWDAHLDGDHWQVHGANKPTYIGNAIELSAEVEVRVPKNGSAAGPCLIQVQQ